MKGSDGKIKNNKDYPLGKMDLHNNKWGINLSQNITKDQSFNYEFNKAYKANKTTIKRLHEKHTPFILPTKKAIQQGQGLCFIAGTKVSMSDGNSKNIENVETGDLIKTYNVKTLRIEDKEVLQTIQSIKKQFVTITFNNGIVNTNTIDHPYYVKGKGWASYNSQETIINYGFNTNRLEEKDICYILINDELKEVIIESIVESNTLTQTYNLSNVADNHNFFANGILVHNKFISNDE